MTSELRPAVAVAEDCHWEYEFKSEEEAAAVIEADREAVRAEQAAELAKWKALAETLAGALEEIERAPAWGYPDKWETTPAQVRVLARQALASYKEQRDA